jgi:hypothetical protein
MESLAAAMLIFHVGACAAAPETVSDQRSPVAAAKTGESGFVDVSVGFQRLPAVDAHYMDGDTDVAGGADPRWRPSRPSHMATAERLAKGPSPGMRDATRYPYLLSLKGDRAGAEAGMRAAKQRYPDSVGVHWSEGWIRLNLKDYEGALVAWSVAEKLHGGQPFWVPYSKAIALAGLGDDEAVLAWWRVAQRSYAPELDSAGGARHRFQHWRDAEKQLLERVIALAYVDGGAISPQQAAREAEVKRIIAQKAAEMGGTPAQIADRQAEIERIIEQRRQEMIEEAANAKSKDQP